MINLEKLFNPKTIALVGASENILKWGAFVFTNIVDGGFEGSVYPVSKSKDTIFGFKAYPTLASIDDTIDLVFITTPSSTVMGILGECADVGIHNIVIITSGFSETGEEGRLLEDKIADFSRKNKMNIVGPNTMGILNTSSSLFATGAHIRPKKGGISIVAQSGNVGQQIMNWAQQKGIGIAKFVGSGNEGVLTCEDYMEYLGEDEETSVILFYIEGIGDGARFMEIAGRVSKKKPIIALKAGRTAAGSKAAASHTGALAASHSVFEGMMKQCGIVIARTPTELLKLAVAFDSLPAPAGNRVAVITLGGGWGVITADECEDRGLVLPALPDSIVMHLDTILPPFWSRGNPVDLVGQPGRNLYMNAIESVLSSDDFDSVIFLGVTGASILFVRSNEAVDRLNIPLGMSIDEVRSSMKDYESGMLDDIIGLMNKYSKPVYIVAMFIDEGEDIIHIKDGSRNKLVKFQSPEEAALCLQKQYRYRRNLEKGEKK